jgi:hypothetical protein
MDVNIIFINFDYPFGIYKLFFYKKQTGNNYLLINIFVKVLWFPPPIKLTAMIKLK